MRWLDTGESVLRVCVPLSVFGIGIKFRLVDFLNL